MKESQGQGSGSTSLLGWLALVLIIIGAISYLVNVFSSTDVPAAPEQEIPVTGGVEYGIPQ